VLCRATNVEPGGRATRRHAREVRARNVAKATQSRPSSAGAAQASEGPGMNAQRPTRRSTAAIDKTRTATAASCSLRRAIMAMESGRSSHVVAGRSFSWFALGYSMVTWFSVAMFRKRRDESPDYRAPVIERGVSFYSRTRNVFSTVRADARDARHSTRKHQPRGATRADRQRSGSLRQIYPRSASCFLAFAFLCSHVGGRRNRSAVVLRGRDVKRACNVAAATLQTSTRYPRAFYRCAFLCR